MNKLCIIVGMTLLGWAGWWLGEQVNFGMAFALSSVGSLVGVYVGWRINRDYFE